MQIAPTRLRGTRSVSHQVVHRQAGVDHVLDDDDVLAAHGLVEVLQQPDAAAAGRSRARVGRDRHRVEPVAAGERAREVGSEHGRALEHRRRSTSGATAIVAVDWTPRARVTRAASSLGRQVDLAGRRRRRRLHRQAHAASPSS